MQAFWCSFDGAALLILKRRLQCNSRRPANISAAYNTPLRLICVRLVIRCRRDSIIAVLTDLTRFMRDQGFSPI